MKMYILVNCFLLCICIEFCYCSAGDSSPYYQKCLERSLILNCTDDGADFMYKKQDLILYYLKWSCEDECKYECMWKTVKAFNDRNWRTPQFYGKWPFVRFLGMQEPASVVFSILNAYFHFNMMNKFRKEVRPDSPLTLLWHIYFMVCVHAWFWSAVFHTRDFPLTELLDYACAFSIVLMNCYVMVIRLLRNKVPKFALITISSFFMAFFINHAVYLSMGRIDYGYNMELNILIGTFTAVCWFGWCMYNRKQQPHVWKCAIFVALTGAVMLLEITDTPPFFHVFDCHSLWHLSTAPLVTLIYSFAIDDCKYLRKTDKQATEGEAKKDP